VVPNVSVEWVFAGPGIKSRLVDWQRLLCIFCCIPHCVHTNVEIVAQIGHDRFLSHCSSLLLHIMPLSVYLYSLSYPAPSAHASYGHLWPVQVYNIFPHYIVHDTVVENKLSYIKYVFWFSLQILYETFLVLRRI
jgi:hypothetical protein